MANTYKLFNVGMQEKEFWSLDSVRESQIIITKQMDATGDFCLCNIIIIISNNCDCFACLAKAIISTNVQQSDGG